MGAAARAPKDGLLRHQWRQPRPIRISNPPSTSITFLLFIMTLFLILLFIYHSTNLPSRDHQPLPNNESQVIQSSKWGFVDLSKEEVPLVLAWNDFFHHGDGSLMQHMRGLGVDTIDCPYECEYTDDRSSYHPNRRTVFIYHSWNVDRDPRDVAHPTGYFLNVFYAVEPPTRTGGFHEELPVDFYNLSMSYRLNSDVWWPYDHFEPIDANTGAEERWNWEEIEQRVAQKDKLAVIFASNCQWETARRMDYVNALAENMPVTRYGGCFHNPCWEDDCFAKELDSHLFYLAFENSVCTDYITEKFWNAKRLIVPVVLSRRVQFANYPPHIPLPAFIAADDFASPKQLAEHLLRLASNRTEYLRMLEWTRHYKRTHIGVLDNEMFVSNAANLCRLCQMAYEGREATVPDIRNKWDTDRDCVLDYSLRVLLNQTN